MRAPEPMWRSGNEGSTGGQVVRKGGGGGVGQP